MENILLVIFFILIINSKGLIGRAIQLSAIYYIYTMFSKYYNSGDILTAIKQLGIVSLLFIPLILRNIIPLLILLKKRRG
jgi:hypothetical protein